MPASETNKAALALADGRDGHTLLKAVYAAAASEPDLAFLTGLHQVQVLRTVLLQNYLTVEDDQGREVIRRREAETGGLPPGRSRITSPYDTGAWRGVKRDPMIAAAILDRLLHRSVVLNIDGNSYRMRSHRARAEATRRGQSPPLSPSSCPSQVWNTT